MKNKMIHIIINPQAGKGKALKQLPLIHSLLHNKNFLSYRVYVTHTKRETAELACKLTDDGARVIVPAGGDGTINDVLNGIMGSRHHLSPDFELGIIKCGTGQGMALSLNIPDDLDKQLDLIISERSSMIDAGKLTYTSFDNTTEDRYFISECQMGIGSVIAQKVHNTPGFLNGKASFALVSFQQAVQYRHRSIGITVDNSVFNGRFLGVAIGNGSLTAGGIKLTPGANPDDGLLNILLIRRMNLFTRLINFSRIYSGNHINAPGFIYLQGKKIQVSGDQETTVSVDGEFIGKTPCTISVIPSAIRVKTFIHQKDKDYERSSFKMEKSRI